MFKVRQARVKATLTQQDGRRNRVNSEARGMLSDDGVAMATVQAHDAWIDWPGERNAAITGEELPHATCTTGAGSLALDGRAWTALVRLGDRVSIFWDRQEILRGRSSRPVSTLEIVIQWYPHEEAGRRLFLGSAWVDLVGIRGTPADLSP